MANHLTDWRALSAGAAAALASGSLGALPDADGATFKVIAPGASRVSLHVEGAGPPSVLDRLADGVFGGRVNGIGPGALYRLERDGLAPFPDPASRFQPLGVHGPSEVVDPAFEWRDRSWSGPWKPLRLYELHVGTFTREGTFGAAVDRLPALASLGVNAIELMPLADFPGNRNWGYDPAALFAPARCYGRPADLRRLVSAAHELGIAVLLDVVYNHLGPDGAYAPAFIPTFFSAEREGPWGQAVNLDGPGSGWVRHFLIENARYWLREFHLDGLRLDATHGLLDEGPRHFLAQLAASLHEDAARAGRRVVIMAEDDRNLDRLVKGPDEGGWGLDGVWADDFHHQVRRNIAGDDEGYYRDYRGTTADIVTTARQGWFYTGQHSVHAGKPRGTSPAGIPAERFVYCIQNHDQVGNRALGERLSEHIDIPTYLAASLLLLTLPQTPLLFMGQEWAASTPFLYFTDHSEPLGRLVTEGRRREFAPFSAFADPGVRELIPDPQEETSFEASRLLWDEASREPHAGVRRFYADLLALRARHVLLEPSAATRIHAPDEDTVCVVRGEAAGGPRLFAVARLRGAGSVELPEPAFGPLFTLLTSEDSAYQAETRAAGLSAGPRQDGQAAASDEDDPGRLVQVQFQRPGGIVILAPGN